MYPGHCGQPYLNNNSLACARSTFPIFPPLQTEVPATAKNHVHSPRWYLTCKVPLLAWPIGKLRPPQLRSGSTRNASRTLISLVTAHALHRISLIELVRDLPAYETHPSYTIYENSRKCEVSMDFDYEVMTLTHLQCLEAPDRTVRGRS